MDSGGLKLSPDERRKKRLAKINALLTEDQRRWRDNLVRVWDRVRRETHLTQEEVALKAGYRSQASFSMRIQGATPVDGVFAARIAAVLKVDPNEIMPEYDFAKLRRQRPPQVVATVRAPKDAVHTAVEALRRKRGRTQEEDEALAALEKVSGG